MLEGPSPRQLDVLKEILSSLEKRGYPPTIREIGDALEVRSTNGISQQLNALAKKGLLEREKTIARGLRLTPRGLEYATGRAA